VINPLSLTTEPSSYNYPAQEMIEISDFTPEKVDIDSLIFKARFNVRQPELHLKVSKLHYTIAEKRMEVS